MSIKPPIFNDLDTLRHRLENAWDNHTIYPGTIMDTSTPLSKGQCGVTSLYLLQILQAAGHDMVFCEGTVSFSNPDHTIENHCWLRNVKDDIILDLTADQNGFEQKIVFDYVENLETASIHYNAKRERSLTLVANQNLLARCLILKQKLSATDNV